MRTRGTKPFSQCEEEMQRWPQSWAGMKEDVPLGKRLVAEFLPFVRHLIESGLAQSTIKRHMGNLWLLGGKIVKNASIYDQLKRPANELLDEELGPEEGPLHSDLSNSEQLSLDATCRKLYRFRQK